MNGILIKLNFLVNMAKMACLALLRISFGHFQEFLWSGCWCAIEMHIKRLEHNDAFCCCCCCSAPWTDVVFQQPPNHHIYARESSNVRQINAFVPMFGCWQNNISWNGTEYLILNLPWFEVSFDMQSPRFLSYLHTISCLKKKKMVREMQH